MKKRLSIIIFVVVALMIVACGLPSVSSLQEKLEEEAEKLENALQTDETQKETDAPATTETDAPAMPEETPKPEPKEAEVTETVLLDEAGVKITAKGMEKSWLGPEIKLLIENNSGKNLTVQTRNSSINGYMIDAMMSADVADGKKANDEMSFSDSDLKQCGIETIADIEFSFHIFTTEDWENYLDSDMIRLETTAAEGYTYTFDDSGELIYDANGVKIVVKGVADDSLMGPRFLLYIENNGDKDVTIQTRNVSVNGFMMDAIFSCDVIAGKHAVDDVVFLSSDFEENGIEKIEEIELSFHIFDMNNWNTIADTDAINIHF